MLDLEPIRKRAEGATPGPWEQWKGHGTVYLGPSHINNETTYSFEDGLDGWELRIEQDDAGGELVDDAAFIAHAREDIPALIAEVERLRGENEDLRADLKDALKDNK